MKLNEFGKRCSSKYLNSNVCMKSNMYHRPISYVIVDSLFMISVYYQVDHIYSLCARNFLNTLHVKMALVQNTRNFETEKGPLALACSLL